MAAAAWDGAGEPVAELLSGAASVPPASHEEEIAGALVEFVSALRSGEVPSGEVHSNVLSLAMVEAAVQSASTGQRVLIDDVMEDAYQTAVASERRADVRAVLEG